jgi:hypothetical protein
MTAVLLILIAYVRLISRGERQGAAPARGEES